MKTRACNYCGKRYTVTAITNDFCSELCELRYCYEYDTGLSDKKYYLNSCRQCKKDFIAVRKKDFCTAKCKKHYLYETCTYTSVCKECGKVYEHHDTVSNYCCDTCRKTAISRIAALKKIKANRQHYIDIIRHKKHGAAYVHRQEPAICLYCGKSFLTVQHNDDKRLEQFCSRTCNDLFIQSLEHNRLPAKVNFQLFTCIVCNATFPYITTNSYQFCSVECKYTFLDKPDKIKDTSTTLSICKECGKVIDDSSSFCSTICQGLYSSKSKMLKFRAEHEQQLREIANRQLQQKTYKKWLGQTPEGYFYMRETDIIYGRLITCKQCGRKYLISPVHIRTTHTYYCSYECFNESKSKWETAICLHCGKEYRVKSTAKAYSQFCSDICEKDFNEQLRYNTTPALISLRQSTCVNCGKTYWNITNHSVMYCSLECKLQFKEKRHLKQQRCIVCGNIFFTAYKRRYCSKRCASTQSKLVKLVKLPRTWKSMLGKKRTLQSRERQSKSMILAIQEGRFRPYSYIQGYMKNIPHYVRSSWEGNFAKILLYLHRSYVFEAKSFKLYDGVRYLPDFYDIRRNIFYEIKGAWLGDSKEKIRTFQELYPHVKLHVIDSRKYKRILNVFKNKISLCSREDIVTKEEYSKQYEDKAYTQWDEALDRRLENLKEHHLKEHK